MPSDVHAIELVLFKSYGQLYARVAGSIICITVRFEVKRSFDDVEVDYLEFAIKVPAIWKSIMEFLLWHIRCICHGKA